MRGKCYPLTDAFMVPNQYPQSRKEPRWRILAQVSENMYILCSALDGCVRYAPMYIHSFRPIAPRKILEAQLFNQQYQNYEDIPNAGELTDTRMELRTGKEQSAASQLQKIYGVKYDYDMMRQSKLEVKKMLGEVTRKPSITQMLQRKEPESQMQKPPKRKQKDYER